MPHITLKNKQNCCGCSACADACPTQCIQMKPDSEGFLYPQVVEENCLNCGKCLTVCPIANAERAKNPPCDDVAYAFVAAETGLVQASSSGGAFSALVAEFVARYPDCFFLVGAAFEGTRLCHIITNDLAEADRLKKSKYLQSDARGIYRAVKERLDEGAAVLFSGTPCMVAALKSFLGKNYEKLLTVDIVCHGVPNQEIFNDYLADLEKKNGARVTEVTFRVKKDFDTEHPNSRTAVFALEGKPALHLDIPSCEYLYGFHTGLFFRPSCEACPFSSPERPGDITLGDFWGIEKKHPELSSARGVSLVHFNAEWGKALLPALERNGALTELTWDYACQENDQLTKPSVPHRNRGKFFRLRRKGVSFIDAVNACKKPDNFVERVLHKLQDIQRKARKKRK